MIFTQEELELIELAVQALEDSPAKTSILRKYEIAKERQAFYHALHTPWTCDKCFSPVTVTCEWATRWDGYCPLCKKTKERSRMFTEPKV